MWQCFKLSKDVRENSGDYSHGLCTVGRLTKPPPTGSGSISCSRVADWSVPCSTTSDVEFVEAPASVALTCDVFEGPATGLASSQ